VLDQAGVNRIDGLAALLPQPLTGDPAPVIANSAAGSCPTTGPIWGEGNILLGGAGSDTITGRGGDDVIDGDKALRVRISVRTNPADAATEVGTTDLMERQYQRDATGALTGPTLQAAVFDGSVDPGDLVVVREILAAPAADSASVDTAVFAGPLSNYTITNPSGSTVRVTQTGANVAGQKADEGTDTLRNVERLRFSDQTVAVAPNASVNPTSQAFATRNVNTTSPAQTTTLTNTGILPLHITSVAIVGTTEFARPALVAANCPAGASTLNPGASCTIPVTFRPTTAGAKSATLRVTSDSNNAAGTNTDVGLTGTGVVAGPIVSLNTATQPFAGQSVNTTSAARTTVLTNTGNQALSLPAGSIAIVGTNPGDFARTAPAGNCGTTLAAGASCNIAITFRPTVAGARSGTLRLTTNSSGVTGKVDTVALTGTGLSGGIGLASPNLTGTTLAFGNARRSGLLGLGGTTVTRNLTVSSTGPGALVISSVQILAAATSSAPNNYSVTANNCGTAARAVGGATCTISVRFAPNATGARNATLRINNNTAAGQTNINLTGNGTN
jgi:hypothetical protein